VTTPADRWLEVNLRWLARELGAFIPPKRPRQVAAHLVREDGPMLVYSVQFPPVGAPDVVLRRLSVNIDGTTTDVEYGVDDAAHEVRCEQGQVVVLTLVDVDDAGNASLPSEPYGFTASDTIPPAAPGQLAATLVGEE
jgi:hypothetical protein